MSKKRKTIVVTGDFTLDWNISRNPEIDKRRWSMERNGGANLSWQRGGAGLLADLIAAFVGRGGVSAEWDLRQPQTPSRTSMAGGMPLDPEDKRFNHSFASWLPFPYSSQEDKHDKRVWRVAEFLGGQTSIEAPGEWARVAGADAQAEVVVLDAAGLGFGERRELWPASLTERDAKPWIVVKMSRPVAKGALWEHLVANHSERLIALMTVNDLRLTDVQISREVSWERTAQDLLWEVAFNPNLRTLKQCAHLVVSFNAAGAMSLGRDPEGKPRCKLIFDPEVVEGMWEQAIPGHILGANSCIAAGIVRAVMLSTNEPQIDEGVRAGLSALRTLYREGYGKPNDGATETGPVFPIASVVEALEKPATSFTDADVPLRQGGSYWTILEDKYCEGLDEIALRVVLRGPEKALQGVPFGRFGKLLTVDRQEIESFRSIRSLTNEYLNGPQAKRPLSIAVFGPPGSGKSFGITQLAMALKPGEIEKKEFNLSQLRSTTELLSAFHQVRDIALRGKVPLIFWDEFDSNFEGKEFGWLRYFLAPMQDGEFLDGGLTHPLGKAIFVFAGGTSATLEGFGSDLNEKDARSIKLPDFVSRLRGYVNVLGPNPRLDMSDPNYVLRRAILLNAMLKGYVQLIRNGEVQIDSGVLRALLLTRTYKHGARSMESLISMSQLDGKSRFERSSLPAGAQMKLHVDGQNFLACLNQLDLTTEVVERLAEAAHEMYCRQQRDLLQQKGITGEKQLGVSPMLVEYGKLPEEIKQQNRDQVRNIPDKLAHAGCYLLPALEHEPPYVFEKETLEELASLEHTRWMRLKARDGWRWGQSRNEENRLHPCMLPWSKGNTKPYAGFENALGDEALPEDQKDKDREAVLAMSHVVSIAGYTIVVQRTS